MNEKEINESYCHIVELLKQKRLKEALSQLEAYLYTCANWPLSNALEEVKTSYQYMLQYMQQGVEDPLRNDLYRTLLRKTWEIAEEGHYCLLDKCSTTYFHTQRNNRKYMPKSANMGTWLETLESFPDDISICRLDPNNKEALNRVLARHEETNQALFAAVVSNSGWTGEEDEQAHRFLCSSLLPVSDLCLFCSAVSLSLLHRFDLCKFFWLLDAYGHQDVRVNQRALISIALVLHTHVDRLPLYPEIATRLSLLNETNRFGQELNSVYIQLLRSKETEKIDKKMREEIIPEVMRNVNLMRNMKYGLEESSMDENDMNPDWEQAFEKSGLGDRIREMNDLQLEGADVYMSSFSQLKNYPFFRMVHNWFYPFEPLHSSVIGQFGLTSPKTHTLLSIILRSGFFCNGDKYSLCFIMSQVPQSQRDMIVSQMTQQDMSELLDESKSAELTQFAMRPEIIRTQYIHDLYRFYKLFRQHNEFHDIFKDEIALHRIPILHEVLYKAEYLKEVADFYFKKEHPDKALEIYRELSQLIQMAEIYQKMGYCLQKERRYREAIDTYTKADVLKPDHLWTLRHLATCYRLSRNYSKALEYYQRVEAIQPENQNLLFFIGSCLAELERYNEALQYFFKLDYLVENNSKAWRAIGWCSFVCGKYEQAIRYYDRLLQAKPQPTDYLNAGHVAWCNGDIRKAVELYSRATVESNSKEAFLEMFEKDKEILLKQGIAEEDIPLVLDMIE